MLGLCGAEKYTVGMIPKPAANTPDADIWDYNNN